MLIPLLFAITGGLVLIILGLGYKHASVVKSRAGAYGSIFMGIAFLVGIGRSFFEQSDWGDWRLWAIGLAMSLIFISCIGLYTWANQVGSVSTGWVIVNLSCIMAIVLSVTFLPDEHFLWLDLLIIAFFIGMILALNAGMKEDTKTTQAKIHPLFWPAILSVFALNGVYLFLMKIKDMHFKTGNDGALLAICFGVAGVMMAFYHVIACRRRGEIPWRREDIIAGTLAGVGAGAGNILLLKGMSLPAVVVYPICQGIPMIGGVIAMALLYRERFNLAKVISLFLALATLFLAIFREKLI